VRVASDPTRSAAYAYAARIDAVAEQRARLQGQVIDDSRWDRNAPSYRFDPHREPETNLRLLASYIEPDDEVIEVGGGAGRIALPLALQCAQVTNVEPSAGMRAEFESLAQEANIDNVHLMDSRWPPGDIGPVGDLAMTEDVTYFIRDIVPFIEGLVAAARRRVIISIWAFPPPAWDAELWRVVFDEPQVGVPGHTDLLPVLWEMGILPDILMMPESFSWPERLPTTRDEAVQFALDQVSPLNRDEAADRVDAEFDDLFRLDGGVFRPCWRPDAPGMLITWETATTDL
jgi:hypothetical protein